MRRDERSMSSTLVRELAVEDDAEYHAMFRMDEADFDYLLNLVSSLIAKQDTRCAGTDRLTSSHALYPPKTGCLGISERMSNYRVI